MRFLVVGLGSIGQRHARNLRALGHDVLGFDADGERLAGAAAGLGLEPLPALAGAGAHKPDAVVICTPPSSHLELARLTLGWATHLFVEKPIAARSEGVADLLAEADARGCRVLVGANLRFFRPLRRVKALVDEGRIGRVLAIRAQCGFHLPFWKPGADYRQTYRAHAAHGGGILLDAIHEFDYLRWMFGPVTDVFCTAGRLSELAIDVEDFAEVTLRFAGGPIAQLHLDYLQRSYRRDCEVIGERGVIVCDYIEGRVTVFGEERDRWEGFREPIDFDHNEMFVEEMRHLVACLEGREQPTIGAGEALAALRLVEAAKASAAGRRWITI